MEYQWDRAKAARNLKKHGVAFADAALALEDPLALTMADPDAIDESRFICLWQRSQWPDPNYCFCASRPYDTDNFFAQGQPL
jgi:uncharacterized DUF497 family protein